MTLLSSLLDVDLLWSNALDYWTLATHGRADLVISFTFALVRDVKEKKLVK